MKASFQYTAYTNGAPQDFYGGSQFFRPPWSSLSRESLKNENKPNQIYTQCEITEIKIPPSFFPTKDCFVVMVGRAPNPGWSFVQQPELEKETLMMHENKCVSLKHVSLLSTILSLCYTSLNVICGSTWRMTTTSDWFVLKQKTNHCLFFFSFLAPSARKQLVCVTWQKKQRRKAEL